MKAVKDFIKSLGYGTLKNLTGSVVDVDHNILDKSIPEIVHWVNEGLTRIHTEYYIEDELSLHIHESRNIYPLRSEYNMTFEDYLKDNPPYERFIWKGLSDKNLGEVEYYNNNLAQVVSVITHEGKTLPLNDPHRLFSAFTPSYDVLQLPVNMLAGMVNVLYRANHPEVSYEDNTIIKLPPSLYDALANYIAYKIYSGINGELAVQNAEKYYNEYRNIINTAITNGVINQNDYQPDVSKFHIRGFV